MLFEKMLVLAYCALFFMMFLILVCEHEASLFC